LDAVLLEFKEMVEYTIQFFLINYRLPSSLVAYCTCSNEWKNCLSLAEPLFSLPASNGKLERIFSQLKVMKTEKRSILNNQQLDDLNTDVIPLANFDANPSIDLWWKEKKQRINQCPRKAYKKGRKSQIF